ncbi:MAG: NADH-quinone oxidoreductase subunit C [Gammaproteobacteria bacterium RIFCSPHIGHO2_12_FULL_41_20]|nr:MAG: NADH-quinone oxidoreductase subunit C [Gammaproteobacteria bacterium RIFCSPHIGHO2_12_FULL_41_20]
MSDIYALHENITKSFMAWIEVANVSHNELTLQVKGEFIRDMCLALRDQADLAFNMLIDVCGVDYLHYGLGEWQTESTTGTGFGRGVEGHEFTTATTMTPTQPRFAVVYHLLSLTHNQRIRLRVYLPESQEPPAIHSVTDIWPAANWFEREAFDLFGIHFVGHPDLRRILTDYGFAGHPFRKDFPLSGKVEVRYDAQQGRVIYEPVSIAPRVLEPKVIRHDHRYEIPPGTGA